MRETDEDEELEAVDVEEIDTASEPVTDVLDDGDAGAELETMADIEGPAEGVFALLPVAVILSVDVAVVVLQPLDKSELVANDVAVLESDADDDAEEEPDADELRVALGLPVSIDVRVPVFVLSEDTV